MVRFFFCVFTIGCISVLLPSFRSSAFFANAFDVCQCRSNEWAALLSQRRSFSQRVREASAKPSRCQLNFARVEEPIPLAAFPSDTSSFSKEIDQLIRLGCCSLAFSVLLVMSGANEAQALDASDVPVIVPCEKVSTGTNNCVSTASVKQVDLFMLPWTWPSDTSVDEIVSRIKGVIAADSTLTLVDSNADRRENDAKDNYFFRVRAARNVCTDEIEFLVNPVDRVITFRSRQVEGPESISDFGANRQRMNDIRQRLAVVTVMGEGSADNGPREDLSGQLRAFWGLQSGSGYESILLDEEE